MWVSDVEVPLFTLTKPQHSPCRQLSGSNTIPISCGSEWESPVKEYTLLEEFLDIQKVIGICVTDGVIEVFDISPETELQNVLVKTIRLPTNLTLIPNLIASYQINHTQESKIMNNDIHLGVTQEIQLAIPTGSNGILCIRLIFYFNYHVPQKSINEKKIIKETNQYRDDSSISRVTPTTLYQTSYLSDSTDHSYLEGQEPNNFHKVSNQSYKLDSVTVYANCISTKVSLFNDSLDSQCLTINRNPLDYHVSIYPSQCTLLFLSLLTLIIRDNGIIKIVSLGNELNKDKLLGIQLVDTNGIISIDDIATLPHDLEGSILSLNPSRTLTFNRPLYKSTLYYLKNYLFSEKKQVDEFISDELFHLQMLRLFTNDSLNNTISPQPSPPSPPILNNVTQSYTMLLTYSIKSNNINTKNMVSMTTNPNNFLKVHSDLGTFHCVSCNEMKVACNTSIPSLEDIFTLWTEDAPGDWKMNIISDVNDNTDGASLKANLNTIQTHVSMCIECISHYWINTAKKYTILSSSPSSRTICLYRLLPLLNVTQENNVIVSQDVHLPMTGEFVVYSVESISDEINSSKTQVHLKRLRSFSFPHLPRTLHPLSIQLTDTEIWVLYPKTTTCPSLIRVPLCIGGIGTNLIQFNSTQLNCDISCSNHFETDNTLIHEPNLIIDSSNSVSVIKPGVMNSTQLNNMTEKHVIQNQMSLGSLSESFMFSLDQLLAQCSPYFPKTPSKECINHQIESLSYLKRLPFFESYPDYTQVFTLYDRLSLLEHSELFLSSSALLHMLRIIVSDLYPTESLKENYFTERPITEAFQTCIIHSFIEHCMDGTFDLKLLQQSILSIFKTDHYEHSSYVDLTHIYDLLEHISLNDTNQQDILGHPICLVHFPLDILQETLRTLIILFIEKSSHALGIHSAETVALGAATAMKRLFTEYTHLERQSDPTTLWISQVYSHYTKTLSLPRRSLPADKTTSSQIWLTHSYTGSGRPLLLGHKRISLVIPVINLIEIWDLTANIELYRHLFIKTLIEKQSSLIYRIEHITSLLRESNEWLMFLSAKLLGYFQIPSNNNSQYNHLQHYQTNSQWILRETFVEGLTTLYSNLGTHLMEGDFQRRLDINQAIHAIFSIDKVNHSIQYSQKNTLIGDHNKTDLSDLSSENTLNLEETNQTHTFNNKHNKLASQTLDIIGSNDNNQCINDVSTNDLVNNIRYLLHNLSKKTTSSLSLTLKQLKRLLDSSITIPYSTSWDTLLSSDIILLTENVSSILNLHSEQRSYNQTLTHIQLVHLSFIKSQLKYLCSSTFNLGNLCSWISYHFNLTNRRFEIVSNGAESSVTPIWWDTRVGAGSGGVLEESSLTLGNNGVLNTVDLGTLITIDNDLKVKFGFLRVLSLFLTHKDLFPMSGLSKSELHIHFMLNDIFQAIDNNHTKGYWLPSATILTPGTVIKRIIQMEAWQVGSWLCSELLENVQSGVLYYIQAIFTILFKSIKGMTLTHNDLETFKTDLDTSLEFDSWVLHFSWNNSIQLSSDSSPLSLKFIDQVVDLITPINIQERLRVYKGRFVLCLKFVLISEKNHFDSCKYFFLTRAGDILTDIKHLVRSLDDNQEEINSCFTEPYHQVHYTLWKTIFTETCLSCHFEKSIELLTNTSIFNLKELKPLILILLEYQLIYLEQGYIDLETISNCYHNIKDINIIRLLITYLVRLSLAIGPVLIRGRLITQILHHLCLNRLSNSSEVALHCYLLTALIQIRIEKKYSFQDSTLINNSNNQSTPYQFTRPAHTLYPVHLMIGLNHLLRRLTASPYSHDINLVTETTSLELDALESYHFLKIIPPSRGNTADVVELLNIQKDYLRNCLNHLESAKLQSLGYIHLPISYFGLNILDKTLESFNTTSTNTVTSCVYSINEKEISRLEALVVLKLELVLLCQRQGNPSSFSLLQKILTGSPQDIAIMLASAGIIEKSLWCSRSWNISPILIIQEFITAITAHRLRHLPLSSPKLTSCASNRKHSFSISDAKIPYNPFTDNDIGRAKRHKGCAGDRSVFMTIQPDEPDEGLSYRKERNEDKEFIEVPFCTTRSIKDLWLHFVDCIDHLAKDGCHIFDIFTIFDAIIKNPLIISNIPTHVMTWILTHPNNYRSPLPFIHLLTQLPSNNVYTANDCICQFLTNYLASGYHTGNTAIPFIPIVLLLQIDQTLDDNTTLQSQFRDQVRTMIGHSLLS